MRTTWTTAEEEWLRENYEKLPIHEIYAHFPHRTTTAIDLKMHRMRLPIFKSPNRERVGRNIVIELLKNRIGDPRFFTPKREFYQRTGIGQKRFGQLYRGEANPTQKEYLALLAEWNITLEEAFEIRQLELKFD